MDCLEGNKTVIKGVLLILMVVIEEYISVLKSKLGVFVTESSKKVK